MATKAIHFENKVYEYTDGKLTHTYPLIGEHNFKEDEDCSGLWEVRYQYYCAFPEDLGWIFCEKEFMENQAPSCRRTIAVPITKAASHSDQLIDRMNEEKECPQCKVHKEAIIELQKGFAEKIQGLHALLKFAGCPQFLIENPQLVNQSDLSSEDIAWAKKEAASWS